MREYILSMTPNTIDRTNLTAAPSQEEIALRAHQLWMEQGCPHGHDVDNWLEAERQLRDGSSTASTSGLSASGDIPAAEDVRTSDVARSDESFGALRDEAPLATKVEDQLLDPGRPAGRRSKTALNL